MTIEELDQYRVGLFADRDTLPEALQYAYEIAKRSDSPPHVLAAVHVVLNTVIKQLTQEQEPVVQ